MSLRGEPVEATAILPDGRSVLVRVGVPEDPYIPRRELDTVDIELFDGTQHLAAVNTVLDAEQVSEARQLVREVVAGLESGDLEPSAGALEPLADTPR
jgi:arginine utilization protein RocB